MIFPKFHRWLLSAVSYMAGIAVLDSWRLQRDRTKWRIVHCHGLPESTVLLYPHLLMATVFPATNSTGHHGRPTWLMILTYSDYNPKQKYSLTSLIIGRENFFLQYRFVCKYRVLGRIPLNPLVGDFFLWKIATNFQTKSSPVKSYWCPQEHPTRYIPCFACLIAERKVHRKGCWWSGLSYHDAFLLRDGEETLMFENSMFVIGFKP